MDTNYLYLLINLYKYIQIFYVHQYINYILYDVLL